MITSLHLCLPPCVSCYFHSSEMNCECQQDSVCQNTAMPCCSVHTQALFKKAAECSAESISHPFPHPPPLTLPLMHYEQKMPVYWWKFFMCEKRHLLSSTAAVRFSGLIQTLTLLGSLKVADAEGILMQKDLVKAYLERKKEGSCCHELSSLLTRSWETFVFTALAMTLELQPL